MSLQATPTQPEPQIIRIPTQDDKMILITMIFLGMLAFMAFLAFLYIRRR